jgi:hypothetical protein
VAPFEVATRYLHRLHGRFSGLPRICPKTTSFCTNLNLQ